MRLNLHCHPAGPVSDIEEISVEWSMSGNGKIWLRYHASGDVTGIKLPAVAEKPQRTDNLWETTCFELFLRKPDEPEYCELNFSPSGNWAAYSFHCYREKMELLALSQSPEIFMDFSDSHVALEVTLGLPDIWTRNELDAGLSAVVEMQSGEKSLWALAHPAAKPDFHHQDGFALKMEAAER